MKRVVVWALIALFTLGAAPAPAPSPSPQIDATVRSQTITAAEKALDMYFFIEKAPAIKAALEAQRAHLVAISDPDKFSDAVTKTMYAVAHDKHLGLHYSSEVLPPHAAGTIKRSPAEIADAKAFFRYVDYGYMTSAHLAGNIGYVRIGGFPDYPSPKNTFDQMMSLMSVSDALIIDMRSNGGGDPKSVNYLLAYFFPKSVEVTGFQWRRKGKVTPEKMYTPVHVGAQRYLKKPVYVLTGTDTISGGEQFCYDMQALHRATLIGATTAGGANIGGDVRLNDHFAIFIPVGTARNPYTGGNWEGTGVKPDIAMDQKAALLKAYTMALQAATDPFPMSADVRAHVLKDPAKYLKDAMGDNQL
ncbi:MAG TPA: S41 family peptidase [Candidatus Baltobacteraceae bacterium]